MDGEFSTVSTPELVSEIKTLAGHLNAANARFLALIAELDRRRGWAEFEQHLWFHTEAALDTLPIPKDVSAETSREGGP